MFRNCYACDRQTDRQTDRQVKSALFSITTKYTKQRSNSTITPKNGSSRVVCVFRYFISHTVWLWDG